MKGGAVNDNDLSRLSDSSMQGIAEKRGFTDRTSRFAFQLERWLRKPRVQARFIRIMRLDESLIRSQLASGSSPPRRQSLSLRGYGYLAPPGVPLHEWQHPRSVRGQDLLPRLLISTYADPDDFGLPPISKRDGFTTSVEQDVCIKVGDTNPGNFLREESIWAFVPLRVLCVMLENGELYWDWTAFEMQAEQSFRERVLCLHYSARCLVYRVIPEILNEIALEENITVVGSSLRL